MFRVPFLATTGWNQAWATYSHLHSDEPQPSAGSSDYVGDPGQKEFGAYLHGTIGESMFAILSEGKLKQSTVNTKQNKVGV